MAQTSRIRRAAKRAVKLRMAIDGPTGSGKTLSALRIARGLVGPTGSIVVIDTEHGTSEKFYAAMHDFDVLPLDRFMPQDYRDAIQECTGHDVLIIDSLSHAWTDGVLAMIDARGSQFNAWKDVTPHHQALVQALLTFPGHLIVTMRSKMAYEVSRSEKGKAEVVKLGLKPVQREGLEYEFDLVGDMDQAHRLVISKSRYSTMADRAFTPPDEALGRELADLASDGAPPPVDTQALARDLLQVAGDRDALTTRLGAAGITSQELADPDVLARARVIAQEVADTPSTDAAEGLEPPHTTPGPTPPSDAHLITKAQRTRLHVIKNGAGWSDDRYRALLRDVAGVDSSLTLARADYERVCTALEAGPGDPDPQTRMEEP